MIHEQIALKYEEDNWKPVLLQEIKKGDVFKMISEDGSFVDRGGSTEFKATKDAVVSTNECKVVVHSVPIK